MPSGKLNLFPDDQTGLTSRFSAAVGKTFLVIGQHTSTQRPLTSRWQGNASAFSRRGHQHVITLGDLLRSKRQFRNLLDQQHLRDVVTAEQLQRLRVKTAQRWRSQLLSSALATSSQRESRNLARFSWKKKQVRMFQNLLFTSRPPRKSLKPCSFTFWPRSCKNSSKTGLALSLLYISSSVVCPARQ